MFRRPPAQPRPVTSAEIARECELTHGGWLISPHGVQLPLVNTWNVDVIFQTLADIENLDRVGLAA